MNDEKRKTSARNALAAYIAANGLRNTPERLAILNAMLELGDSFSVGELGDAVSAKGLRVSRATLYNALHVFAEAGIVGRRLSAQPGDGRSVAYGLAEQGSVAVCLVCKACGKRRAVRDTTLARVLAARHYGSFSVSGIEVCVSGLCSRCRSARKKLNKNK